MHVKKMAKTERKRKN